LGKSKEQEAQGRKKRGRLVDEIESVGVFLRHYEQLNNTVHFQPIPPMSELQARIPAGREAIAIKTFEPPAPAMAPRDADADSPRQHAEDLILAESPAKDPTYALQGRYY